MYLEIRERLAEALVARCPAPLDRVFLCNSGAEANENALHLARRATGRCTVVSVEVAVGDTVAAGQTLVVLEAMKMEHAVQSPSDGTVVEVDVAVGDQVTSGQVLAVVE